MIFIRCRLLSCWTCTFLSNTSILLSVYVVPQVRRYLNSRSKVFLRQKSRFERQMYGWQTSTTSNMLLMAVRTWNTRTIIDLMLITKCNMIINQFWSAYKECWYTPAVITNGRVNLLNLTILWSYSLLVRKKSDEGHVLFLICRCYQVIRLKRSNGRAH